MLVIWRIRAQWTGVVGSSLDGSSATADFFQDFHMFKIRNIIKIISVTCNKSIASSNWVPRWTQSSAYPTTSCGCRLLIAQARRVKQSWVGRMPSSPCPLSQSNRELCIKLFAIRWKTWAGNTAEYASRRISSLDRPIKAGQEWLRWDDPALKASMYENWFASFSLEKINTRFINWKNGKVLKCYSGNSFHLKRKCWGNETGSQFTPSRLATSWYKMQRVIGIPFLVFKTYKEFFPTKFWKVVATLAFVTWSI